MKNKSSYNNKQTTHEQLLPKCGKRKLQIFRMDNLAQTITLGYNSKVDKSVKFGGVHLG